MICDIFRAIGNFAKAMGTLFIVICMLAAALFFAGAFPGELLVFVVGLIIVYGLIRFSGVPI
jgi:hypothetical protein